jgi:hypothetical protein
MSPLVSIRSYKLVDWELWNVKLRILSLAWVGFKNLHAQTRSGNILVYIEVTYSQFDSNIRVLYVFWGFLKNI